MYICPVSHHYIPEWMWWWRLHVIYYLCHSCLSKLLFCWWNWYMKIRNNKIIHCNWFYHHPRKQGIVHSLWMSTMYSGICRIFSRGVGAKPSLSSLPNFFCHFNRHGVHCHHQPLWQAQKKTAFRFCTGMRSGLNTWLIIAQGKD